MVVRMMRTLISALFALLRAALMPRTTLALENAALRQQLAISQRTHNRTRLRAEDRVFWVALRRLWSDWTRPLVIVKPATVLGWHREGFKALWRRKSRSGKIGRPRIPGKHIGFIQRISGDHPEWGEDTVSFVGARRLSHLGVKLLGDTAARCDVNSTNFACASWAAKPSHRGTGSLTARRFAAEFTRSKEARARS
jgi:hypothetical protein